MSKIGYRNDAILYTLKDEKIQTIKCKENTKKIITSAFMGGGKLSQGQTLEISTKDRLLKSVQAGVTRCFYNNQWYIVISILGQDVAPIKQRARKIKDNILVLQ